MAKTQVGGIISVHNAAQHVRDRKTRPPSEFEGFLMITRRMLTLCKVSFRPIERSLLALLSAFRDPS